MQDSAAIEMLKSLPLFGGLDATALAEVLRWSHRRRIVTNEILFTQGADASSFFVLLSGHLKVTQNTADGDQVVLHYVGPGKQFGCAALMGKPAYPGTATAVEDGHVLGWTRSVICMLMDQHPIIARNALSAVGQRLGEIHDRLRTVTTGSVERRVAHVLLQLIVDNARRVGGGYEIDFPISRQDVAEMTGATLFTVSRVLKAWETRGLVASRRRHITVLQPGELSIIAEEPLNIDIRRRDAVA